MQEVCVYVGGGQPLCELSKKYMGEGGGDSRHES